MTVTLETLELNVEQYRNTKDAVRRMAHSKWIEAGRPDGDKEEYWLEAEREWIERCYVPDRSVFGRRNAVRSRV